MNKMIRVDPDGTVIVTEPLTEFPPLATLQEAVGGHIELIPFFSRWDGSLCMAYCNTDSKMKGLPRNEPANHLWDMVLAAQGKSRFDPARLNTELDYLAGPIVIIVGDRSFIFDEERE
jgi:hypothetical protein